MNHHGQSDITGENVIFVVVNLIFFIMLMLFIFRAGTGAYFFEQYYAKQIATLVDDAKPGTNIALDATDAYDTAKKNNIDFKNIVRAENNTIIVQLAKGRYYQHPFYNNVSLEFGPAQKEDKFFIIIGVKQA